MCIVCNLYTPHKQLISYTFLTHLRIDVASFMWTSSSSYTVLWVMAVDAI